MGYAFAVINGRKVGYGVKDICNLGGCGKKIDRGLAYLCGDISTIDDVSPAYGCNGYFCDAHLYFSRSGGPGYRCVSCIEKERYPEDEEED